MTKKQIAYFILVVAVLLVGRLSIAGTGYLEDQDEFLYIWIHMNADSFHHLSTWVDSLFRLQGQPPEVAIRLCEYYTLMPIASAMHKQMLHPDILYFIGLYNILASLLILYVFYRILLKLKFSVELAITGVLLLGTLFHSNMYTRHILPYDHALLFQLLALNLLLRDDLRARTVLFAGLLSAIGLTAYYGGFMFIFINGGYILLSQYKNPKIAIRNSLLFVSSFIFLLTFYELYTRIDGRSYLDFFKTYSHTVGTEGSTEEGLSFVFIYFWLVEKWWGAFLLMVYFPGCYLLFKVSESAKERNLILLSSLAYICFGSCIFFLHKLVFDGRVLHIYFPFIVLGVLSCIRYQKLIPTNKIVLVFVCFACINYFFVIRDFRRIGYPRNAIYKYHLFETSGTKTFTYYNEVGKSIQYSDRRQFGIDSVGPNILPTGHYILQNIAFLPTYSDSMLLHWHSYQLRSTDSVLFEELHFESHPAYTLEYCTRTGRQFFLDKQIKIRVIKTRE